MIQELVGIYYSVSRRQDTDLMFRLAFIYTNMQNVAQSTFSPLSIDDALKSPVFWNKQESINFIVATCAYAEMTEFKRNSFADQLNRCSNEIFPQVWDTTTKLKQHLEACCKHEKKENSKMLTSTRNNSTDGISTSYFENSNVGMRKKVNKSLSLVTDTENRSVYNTTKFGSMIKVLRNQLMHKFRSSCQSKHPPSPGLNDVLFDEFSIPHPKFFVMFFICACKHEVSNVSTYIPTKKIFRTPTFYSQN